ncbi:MAG: SGNH/GDSL hydrolase family protein [Acidobacteriaceae bacterium]
MKFRCAFGLALGAALLAGVAAQSQTNWVGTWAASQQIPEPANSLAPEPMRDATIRQIFHVSIGGSVVRMRLSNAFGTEPLRFTSVHIARPVAPPGAQVDPASDRVVTFFGKPDVIVPAGAEYLSDPIPFALAPLSSVAVSFFLEDAPAVETGHPGSRETTYYAHGDLTGAAELPGAQTIDHWYQVSGIEVEAPPQAAAIAVVGDSITDGHASTTNGNDRWTDFLAARLQASPATREISVLNEGIGGNRLLQDGAGPNVLARLNRDVLAQAGVRWLIVLEGVNDLGMLTRDGPAPPAAHAALVERIEAGYQQIVERAHERGIEVIGGTITPYMGSDYYHPDAANEADREAVNAWIRTPGHFDAVIDFDRALRDPQHPDRLRPQLDCGDHLHPNPAGYKVMAEAVPLGLFAGQPWTAEPGPAGDLP